MVDMFNDKFLTSIVLCVAAICMSPLPAAATLENIKSVPHLDSAGQEGYREFLASDKHRAFAVAPGGSWAWKGGAISAQVASTEALTTCQSDSSQSCIVYAIDDKVVFDAHVWERLWGPYLNRAEANRARIGLNRGERFYNLIFRNEAGKRMSLSAFQGKVVLLHIWGSWCSPCRREIPDLQQLHKALGASPDIQMVLLQVQEDFGVSQQWVRQQHLNLPLFDSGAKGNQGDALTLMDGTRMHDRDVAPAFPTTYILDKHGIIVFSNIGPVSRWSEYLPLLRDVAKHSGN
jgi:thiol-disulfide isomerase/thioredoxin